MLGKLLFFFSGNLPIRKGRITELLAFSILQKFKERKTSHFYKPFFPKASCWCFPALCPERNNREIRAVMIIEISPRGASAGDQAQRCAFPRAPGDETHRIEKPRQTQL